MSFEEFQSPARPRTFTTPCKVTKHLYSKHKLMDWGLSFNKRWVILGDSNVGRFPTHNIADLQVDCFPDGNYRHITEVIIKATSHTMVERMILFFSLACRKQKVKETGIKQLRAAVRMAQTLLPGVQVFIPILNVPEGLPAGERTALIRINKYVARTFPHIPPLDDELVETTRGHLWTKNTAKAIFTHWVTYLNFTAP